MYEVYECNLNGVCLYVGSGKLGRHQHCLSGISHVYGLNRLHFSNVHVNVEVLKTFETKDEAVEFEINLIKLNNPKFNKVFSDKLTAETNNKCFGEDIVNFKHLDSIDFKSVCYCGYKYCTNKPEMVYDYTTLEEISENFIFKKSFKGYQMVLNERLLAKCDLLEGFSNFKFKSKKDVRKFCVSVILFYDTDWENSEYDVGLNWKYMVLDGQIKVIFED